MNEINNEQENNSNKNSKRDSLWSNIVLSARKKVKRRKLIKIIILVLMISSAIPAALSTVPQFFQDPYVKKLLSDHRSLYIVVFMISATSLSLLAFLFPKDYKEVKSFANIKLYDDSNLKADAPKVVWMSLFIAVVLALVVSWIFIR